MVSSAINLLGSGRLHCEAMPTVTKFFCSARNTNAIFISKRSAISPIIQILISTELFTVSTNIHFILLACVPRTVGCNRKVFVEQMFVIIRENYTGCSTATVVYGDIFVAEIRLKLLLFCVTSLRCLKMRGSLKHVYFVEIFRKNVS